MVMGSYDKRFLQKKKILLVRFCSSLRMYLFIMVVCTEVDVSYFTLQVVLKQVVYCPQTSVEAVEHFC